MSTRRGKNAIVNSFKLNFLVFKGIRKVDSDVHIHKHLNSGQDLRE